VSRLLSKYVKVTPAATFTAVEVDGVAGAVTVGVAFELLLCIVPATIIIVMIIASPKSNFIVDNLFLLLKLEEVYKVTLHNR
jgi:hypothetical protein